MDALRLMLLSLLIGATVSTGPAYINEGMNEPAVAQATAVRQAAEETLQPWNTPSATLTALQPSAQETVQPLSATPDPAQQALATSEPAVRPLLESPAPTLQTLSTPSPTVMPLLASAPTPAQSKTTLTPLTLISSASTEIKRELSRGSEGDDVRMLQKLLKDLGYSVEVDGYFGTQTRNAVLSFQRNNGLKADGIAGSRTVRRLSGGSAVEAGGISGQRTTLSYGMRGQDVYELQSRLKQLGYYFDVLSGNYLKNTRSAVRWFQQAHGLSQDGIAGPQTMSFLFSSSAVSAPGYPAWQTYPPSYPSGYFYRTLYQGMSGADVTYLQQLLAGLGYFHVAPTGYFGATTYWAAQVFQMHNNLVADGIVGAATQERLTSGYAIAYQDAVPAPTPTLHPVDTRPPVISPWLVPAPTENPTIISPVGASEVFCSYCGNTVVAGQEAIHTSMAACGIHRGCGAGDHTQQGCGDFICKQGIHQQCLYCGVYECEKASGETCAAGANLDQPCVYN